MKFFDDENIDFINSLLLAYGYWQKMHELNTGRVCRLNGYQRRFQSLMKSHEKHPFFSILKSIADMNPPPSAFMQMILHFNRDCSSCIEGVDVSDVIPRELDSVKFIEAMADLRLKFAYSVVIEKTKAEREALLENVDDFSSMKAAKGLAESIFPRSKSTADPLLVLSPLSSGNFTFSAGGKDYIITSSEGVPENGWRFCSKKNLHARYFQFKLEKEIQADLDSFMPEMKRGERFYADRAYSIKSGLDDREAMAATVRQALSAYLLAEETSTESAELYLSTAMKRGLSLVSASFSILRRTFSESGNGVFDAKLFFGELSAFVQKSL